MPVLVTHETWPAVLMDKSAHGIPRSQVACVHGYDPGAPAVGEAVEQQELHHLVLPGGRRKGERPPRQAGKPISRRLFSICSGALESPSFGRMDGRHLNFTPAVR